MTAYVSIDFEFDGLKKDILSGDEAVSLFFLHSCWRLCSICIAYDLRTAHEGYKQHALSMP